MLTKIKSQAEYEAALARIHELWGAEPNTREGAELDALFDAAEKYEVEHYSMDEPDSYAAVEFHLDRLNLSIDILAISDSEKAILEACISREQLVPEWLLVKVGNLLGIQRDVLGRAGSSRETFHSHNKVI